MKKPLVSVVMITYNHENFIRDAIEGVLMQTCDFDIELIVANDCSTDKTDEVILDIIKNHPRAMWIKYIKHEKNIGMMPNFVFALQECQGQYIALCDGDDYWSDTYKLQKQVSFLEANPEYIIHSGVAKVFRGNENEEYIGAGEKDEVFELKDFYGQNHIATSTILFRNDVTNWPQEFNNVIFGDWFLYMVLLHQSGLKAYRSTEIFSVYRIHDKGIMKSLSLLKNQELHLYQLKIIKQYVGYKNYPLSTIKWINNYSISKFRIEFRNQMYIASLKTFLINLIMSKFKISIRRYLSVLRHNVKIFPKL
jgi:glycosyltransferase involved in cell wall biosynthesis